MNTATFIKNGETFPGVEQRLYHLDPPMHAKLYGYGGEHERCYVIDYVIVSASSLPLMEETYIFAADSEGNVINWHELDGSFKGDLDHDLALKRAGYAVKE